MGQGSMVSESCDGTVAATQGVHTLMGAHTAVRWSLCPPLCERTQPLPPPPPAASTAGGPVGGATGSSTASMACAAPEQTGRSPARTAAELLAPTKRTWRLWLDAAPAPGLTCTVKLRRLPCGGAGGAGHCVWEGHASSAAVVCSSEAADMHHGTDPAALQDQPA